jgi:hypothetical protein
MDRGYIIALMNQGQYVNAYTEAFPNWGPALGLLPSSLQGGIARYILQGIEPGHFLTAVISNDLFGAFGRADQNSVANMERLVKFFYNYAPSNCYRSPAHLEAWAKNGGHLGHENETA